MIGYKAFDENLQCRGFQFEVGKTYETGRATLFADINYNEPDNYGTEKEIGYHDYYCGVEKAGK